MEQGKLLPAYVQQEFAAYLKCARPEHGLHAPRVTPGILPSAPSGSAFGCSKSLPANLSRRAGAESPLARRGDAGGQGAWDENELT